MCVYVECCFCAGRSRQANWAVEVFRYIGLRAPYSDAHSIGLAY